VVNDNNDNVIPLHPSAVGWASCPYCEETDYFSVIVKMEGGVLEICSLVCWSEDCNGDTSIDVSEGLRIIDTSDN